MRMSLEPLLSVVVVLCILAIADSTRHRFRVEHDYTLSREVGAAPMEAYDVVEMGDDIAGDITCTQLCQQQPRYTKYLFFITTH